MKQYKYISNLIHDVYYCIILKHYNLHDSYYKHKRKNRNINKPLIYTLKKRSTAATSCIYYLIFPFKLLLVATSFYYKVLLLAVGTAACCIQPVSGVQNQRDSIPLLQVLLDGDEARQALLHNVLRS